MARSVCVTPWHYAPSEWAWDRTAPTSTANHRDQPKTRHGGVIMSQTIATIADVPIPDTPLVREATELARAATNDLLFDHSRRVYLWGTLKSHARGLTAAPEL